MVICIYITEHPSAYNYNALGCRLSGKAPLGLDIEDVPSNTCWIIRLLNLLGHSLLDNVEDFSTRFLVPILNLPALQNVPNGMRFNPILIYRDPQLINFGEVRSH